MEMDGKSLPGRETPVQNLKLGTHLTFRSNRQKASGTVELTSESG